MPGVGGRVERTRRSPARAEMIWRPLRERTRRGVKAKKGTKNKSADVETDVLLSRRRTLCVCGCVLPSYMVDDRGEVGGSVELD